MKTFITIALLAIMLTACGGGSSSRSASPATEAPSQAWDEMRWGEGSWG